MDLGEHAARGGVFGESVSRAIGEIGDAREVTFDREVGIGVARNFERGSRQVDAIVPGDEALEFGRFGVQQISISPVPALFWDGPFVFRRLQEASAAGLVVFFLVLALGLLLPKEPLKIFPRRVRLSPLPIVDRSFQK